MGWIFLLGFGLGLVIGLAITCLAVLGAASIIHKSDLELVGNRLVKKDNSGDYY